MDWGFLHADATCDVAHGVFLSSSGGSVLPVASLDGVAVGGQSPGAFGPVAEGLQRDHRALHEDPRYSEAARARAALRRAQTPSIANSVPTEADCRMAIRRR